MQTYNPCCNIGRSRLKIIQDKGLPANPYMALLGVAARDLEQSLIFFLFMCNPLCGPQCAVNDGKGALNSMVLNIT